MKTLRLFLILLLMLSTVFVLARNNGNQNPSRKKQGNAAIKKKHYRKQNEFIKNNFSNEEQEELKYLYSNNPKEFRRRIREKVRKLRRERAAFYAEINALAQKYRSDKTLSNAEKRELKMKIRAKLKTIFDKKMAQNRKNIERAKKTLEHLIARYEKQKKLEKEIIDNKLKNLLKE